MAKRIIDNKQVDLTDSEFAMYQKICRSYDGPHTKGEDYFKDLFETDGNGTIIFVKPPTKMYSSMEIYLYLISIMNNQHLRINYEQVQLFVEEAKEQLNDLYMEGRELIEQIRDIIKKDK